MFRLDVFTKGFLALGVCLALTPAMFEVGPWIESKAFPVVRGTQVLNAEQTPRGISFYVRFRKVRGCEYLGLVWYEGPARLMVEFEPGAEDLPRTRPPGQQFTGPWLVQGLTDIAQSRAYLYHRCHPLWTTVTRFYYGEDARRTQGLPNAPQASERS